MGATSPNWKVTSQTECEQQVLTELSSSAMDQESERNEGENSGRSSSLPRHVISEHKIFLGGPLLPDNALSPKKVMSDENRSVFIPSKVDSKFFSFLFYRFSK